MGHSDCWTIGPFLFGLLDFLHIFSHTPVMFGRFFVLGQSTFALFWLVGLLSHFIGQLSVMDFFCCWTSSWTSCVFVLHLLSLILVYILFCAFCVAQSVPRTNRGHLRMMVILRSWLGIPGCGGGEEGWIRSTRSLGTSER